VISITGTTAVIPTFNESDNIVEMAETIFRLYPDIHVLVVDDNSPDGTADLVRRLQPKYPNLTLLERRKDFGFGRSYRDGFRQAMAHAGCRAVVMMDADFSHDPAVIRRLVAGLSESDVVVGSRYVTGGSVPNWSLHRRMLSRFSNFYVRAVLGIPLRDFTSGFLAVRREMLERVPFDRMNSEGYAFQVDLKCAFVRLGAKIAEHPIAFHERREGQSKMSSGKIWEAAWLPWRLRFQARTGAAGTARKETQDASQPHSR
jgi:dolichol-phosphate mannosyltransferase